MSLYLFDNHANSKQFFLNLLTIEAVRMANRFDQMRAFTSVVEAGGFSRAASRAGVSRAAVSRLVGDLEARLGVRLLNRTTRQMHLTEAGSSFYERCRHLLDDLEDAERSVSDSSVGPQGRLKVVAPVNFALSDLGEGIAQFLRMYPKIRLDLSLNDQIIDPVEGGFDIAIRLCHSEPQLPKTLDAHLINHSTRVLCASPKYLSENGEPKKPQDLTGHECISFSYVEDPSVWRLYANKREHAVPINSRITTSSERIITAAAVEGLGVAYGPRAFFRDHIDAGALRQVLTSYSLPRASIYSLFVRSPFVPDKVDAFNGFMEQFLRGRIS